MTDSDEPKNDLIEPAEGGSAAPEDAQPAELMLIQVAEDAAVVFGPNTPSWLDVRPLLGATPADHTRLADAAALAVGVGNVALQLSPALMAAQGIVQLSPVTMAALQTMAPVVGANGWNIGTLAVAGQFGHSVQWAPMAAASGVSFAATLGPSLALLGIQVQLMQISRKVDANIALTKDVLAELKWANDADLVALLRTVRRAYEEAVSIGAVTSAIYGEIQGKEHLLDKCRTLLMTRIQAYVEEVNAATTRDARRKWITDHGERCLDDLQSLVQVHQAWFVFQALRAASVAEADSSDRGTRLVTRIRTTATEENESTVALIVGLADRLQRALGLLEESGNRRLGRFKSAREARSQAQALRAFVLATVPAAASDPAQPEVVLAASDKLSRACRMLPLLLAINQPPLLAGTCVVDAEANGILDFDRNAFLFVLADEVVVTREKALFNDHRIERRIPATSIRFVRADLPTRRAEIASTEGFLSLTWSPEVGNGGVTYANELLKSLMSLPQGEVPSRPAAPVKALMTRMEELEAEVS